VRNRENREFGGVRRNIIVLAIPAFNSLVGPGRATFDLRIIEAGGNLVSGAPAAGTGDIGVPHYSEGLRWDEDLQRDRPGQGPTSAANNQIRNWENWDRLTDRGNDGKWFTAGVAPTRIADPIVRPLGTVNDVTTIVAGRASASGADADNREKTEALNRTAAIRWESRAQASLWDQGAIFIDLVDSAGVMLPAGAVRIVGATIGRGDGAFDPGIDTWRANRWEANEDARAPITRIWGGNFFRLAENNRRVTIGDWNNSQTATNRGEKVLTIDLIIEVDPNWDGTEVFLLTYRGQGDIGNAIPLKVANVVKPFVAYVTDFETAIGFGSVSYSEIIIEETRRLLNNTEIRLGFSETFFGEKNLTNRVRFGALSPVRVAAGDYFKVEKLNDAEGNPLALHTNSTNGNAARNFSVGTSAATTPGIPNTHPAEGERTHFFASTLLLFVREASQNDVLSRISIFNVPIEVEPQVLFSAWNNIGLMAKVDRGNPADHRDNFAMTTLGGAFGYILDQRSSLPPVREEFAETYVPGVPTIEINWAAGETTMDHYYVDGERVEIREDLRPANINDSWFVPVRLFAEMLGVTPPGTDVNLSSGFDAIQGVTFAIVDARFITGIERRLEFYNGDNLVMVTDSWGQFPQELIDGAGNPVAAFIPTEGPNAGRFMVPLRAGAALFGLEIHFENVGGEMTGLINGR
jgi:hypothetical protein